VALQPARVVSRLDELRSLTGDENGAQRVAWTETWARGRAWLADSLADLPLEVERDAAGNDWYTLRGESERAVLIGGHMDSVPNGGWLDGCLNVLAGALPGLGPGDPLRAVLVPRQLAELAQVVDGPARREGHRTGA